MNQPKQAVTQSGKFGVNIGEGQDVHIGDVYQADPETIKRIVREELRLPQTEYHQSVSLGLNALAELMKVPEVQSAVVAFRVDFQAACEQIDVIADYKDLHDLLHTLEFQCYGVIVQEVKRFPDDEVALDDLDYHRGTLQQLIRGIQKVTSRETIAAREVSWLRDLERSQEELQGALEELDLRRLQRTIWLLNRVLAVQPSRINTNLNVAARTLRLPALVTALQFIWESLSHSQLDQEKVRQFQRGVETLAELNQRLAALVVGHDYWQEIDLELRRIEANLDQDPIELEMSWPDLKERTAVLFEKNTDEWALAFQKDYQKLDDSLTSHNPARIRRYFRMYRRRASDRFYQVDTTLKRLCDELRKVGEPLTFVLRMME